jgi:hypothetical protein
MTIQLTNEQAHAFTRLALAEEARCFRAELAEPEHAAKAIWHAKRWQALDRAAVLAQQHNASACRTCGGA